MLTALAGLVAPRGRPLSLLAALATLSTVAAVVVIRSIQDKSPDFALTLSFFHPANICQEKVLLFRWIQLARKIGQAKLTQVALSAIKAKQTQQPGLASQDQSGSSGKADLAICRLICI
ncbi:MAG TPA: hypothetical protein DCW97_03780 [Acidobacteria bacterium]|nr:hypothetical protein [Acidobacteriota bacterium]